MYQIAVIDVPLSLFKESIIEIAGHHGMVGSAVIYNIGIGTDVMINQLAHTVMQAVGFDGQIEFDSSKPDGTLCKLLDVSSMANPGWSPRTSLSDGKTFTYRDFLERCGRIDK